MIRPVRLLIETVYRVSGLTGHKWEHRASERFDYFPNDEPLTDLFELVLGSDVEPYLVCPCGESLPLGTWLDELHSDADEHVRREHPGRA